MPADSLSRMDLNGSGNESKGSESMLSSSPGASSSRERTDSESSSSTDNMRFVLPSVDGSPPKVLTLNELAGVVKNIKNMEFAHEIALNPDFKLQPYEPPEKSLERRIKDIMHRLFWDKLREQIESKPPCYDHAIQLLAEIKDCFPQIMSPNNKRALEHINEVLDETVIRQQAEKGLLDFKVYANFVIQIMAKSCAPARDDAVAELSKIDDVVDTFKGILDVMSLMKLDMVNFVLDSARQDIMANSVEYEKKKFQEYLVYYKFGFPATENWLQRNCLQDASNAANTAESAITNAYIELMNWDLSNEFPEILSIDKERILKLCQRARRLCACAALISICYAMPIISQRSKNRVALAKQIEIILQDVTNEAEMSAAIENIWEQIKTVINGYLEKEDQPQMDAAAENLLKTQVMQIADMKTPVQALMWKRLQTYFRLTLRSKAGMPPPPPGYVDFKDELESYACALKRVIIYNHSVFGDYFLQILTKQREQSNDNEDNNERDQSLN